MTKLIVRGGKVEERHENGNRRERPRHLYQQMALHFARVNPNISRVRDVHWTASGAVSTERRSRSYSLSAGFGGVG